MRVLLVYKNTIAIERIAICCLSAALKEKGHEVRLVIVGITDHADILQTVKDFRPGVIGYTAMTGEHDTLLDLNREFKTFHDFFAVMGGPHATFCPDVLEEEGLNAICTGEGDLVFPELCRCLDAGEDYTTVSTFNFRLDGKIISNPKADLVEDLDDLPFPDRQILYDADPQFLKTSTKFFMAARGCPYKCSYCFNVKYNEAYKNKGKIIRCRSPEKMIQEIEWVIDNHFIRHVSFIDDLFILKPKEWIREFADLYKERIGLPFDCTVRANAVRDETIATLKDAGMAFVWMGVESGDEVAAN
ncbi:MAG: radical SAM protein, partial [Proteobacteria bacterium]|nr:radical SAM protein [Pseudomonadota bacterium]